MLGLAQGEGFRALQQLESVERAERRTEVAQELHADFEDKRHVAHAGHVVERLPEFQAVVAGVRIGELGELAVVPGEFAAVDDDPAERSSVPAEVFGGGGDDDVHAVVKGAHQSDADGVVHDQRYAGSVGDLGKRGEVGDVQLGIADGLGEDRPGLRADGLTECLGVAGIDELHRAAELGEGVVEKLIGAAVEVVAGHDLVAHLGDGEQGEAGGGLAGGDREGPGAALDGRDALLEHVGGRVHQAGVDVTRFLKREQVGGVFGAFENVGGGLVDGDGAGPGGGVGLLAGVQTEGGEGLGGLAHGC